MNKLSTKQKISYAYGDLASNLVWQLIALYLTIFYTDVFGLAPAAVAVLFLVARIWDAINDPIMGSIIDKTKTKYGKFRPYILYGSIPLAIFIVLTFTVPNFSYTGKLIYAYITYIGAGMAYTLINIPYSAMTSSLTQDSTERASLSAVRITFAVLGGLVVGGTTMILVKLFGGSADPSAWQKTVMVFAALGILFFYLTFKGTKEVYTSDEKVKVSFETYKNLVFKNKPLMILSITFMLTILSSTLRTATVAYFFKYNVGNEGLGTIYIVVTILSMVAGMTLVKPFSVKYGKKKASIIGWFIKIIGLIGVFITYYLNLPFALIFVFAAIAGFGSALPTALAWGMLPDTVEYAEYHTGIRAEGIIYSSYSFAQKFGTAIGASLTALILALVNFVADTVQSDQTLFAILLMLTLIPVVINAIAIVIINFYPLSKEKHQEILDQLNK